VNSTQVVSSTGRCCRIVRSSSHVQAAGKKCCRSGLETAGAGSRPSQFGGVPSASAGQGGRRDPSRQPGRWDTHTRQHAIPRTNALPPFCIFSCALLRIRGPTLATSSRRSSFLPRTEGTSRDAGTVMASHTPSASVSRSVSSGSLPSRHATPVSQLTSAEKEKETLVRAAIDNGDVTALVDLATSPSGLISDSLRCGACMPPFTRVSALC
jgi:hypothetical protein